jgi:hypothetical protein
VVNRHEILIRKAAARISFESGMITKKYYNKIIDELSKFEEQNQKEAARQEKMMRAAYKKFIELRRA